MHVYYIWKVSQTYTHRYIPMYLHTTHLHIITARTSIMRLIYTRAINYGVAVQQLQEWRTQRVAVPVRVPESRRVVSGTLHCSLGRSYRCDKITKKFTSRRMGCVCVCDKVIYRIYRLVLLPPKEEMWQLRMVRISAWKGDIGNINIIPPRVSS